MNRMTVLAVRKFSTAILASLFFSLAACASDIQIELARSCSDETPAEAKLSMATAKPMIGVTGPDACIDKTTRVKLTATGIKAYKNQFQAGSVELALTPESSEQWMRLQKDWLGKEMVLMSGGKSILYARVFSEQSERNLKLFAKDEAQAKQIAEILSGGTGEVAKPGN